MGRWGTGIFDSDDALDIAARVVEERKIDAARNVLHSLACSSIPELDADRLQGEVLASAAIVAAACGSASPDLPDDLSEWIKFEKPVVDAELLDCALTALVRVLHHFQESDRYWSVPERFQTLPAWVQGSFGYNVQNTTRLIDTIEHKRAELKQ